MPSPCVPRIHLIDWANAWTTALGLGLDSHEAIAQDRAAKAKLSTVAVPFAACPLRRIESLDLPRFVGTWHENRSNRKAGHRMPLSAGQFSGRTEENSCTTRDAAGER